VTSLWFFAFGDIASTIARNARKGDQLILEARVVANNWTDKGGERQYGHTFIATGVKFGARRGWDGSPIAVRTNPRDKPLTDAAEAAMALAV
jgi:single-stranded DNA-binding protein